jgi:hypothetical protein
MEGTHQRPLIVANGGRQYKFRPTSPSDVAPACGNQRLAKLRTPCYAEIV